MPTFFTVHTSYLFSLIQNSLLFLRVFLTLLQETLLLQPMFEAPGSDIVSVHITKDVVKGTKPAEYVHSPEKLKEEDATQPGEGTEIYNDDIEMYAGDASSRL